MSGAIRRPGNGGPARHRWRLELAAIAAQVGAETRIRLRSPGTVLTVLALFAAAFTYLPPPESNRVSLLWQVGGRSYSGTYTSGFLGAVVAMLTASLLPLLGFYLVTGSVRRDLERRVWPIVAATPSSPAAYLLGKWLAGTGYLLVLATLGLVSAAILFLQHGSGPLRLGELLAPWLLLVPPAMAMTASLALLFDVTPGLRGRVGYVLWFFTHSLLLLMVPLLLAGLLDQDRRNDRRPVYDPTGFVFFHRHVTEAVGGSVEGISMGVVLTDQPIERVPLAAMTLDARSLARRSASAAWAVAPLLAALVVFRLSRGRPPRQDRPREGPAGAVARQPTGPAPVVLPAVRPTRPGLALSLGAEVALTWSTAGVWKWPLLVAALAAGVAPDGLARGAFALFLLLLGPLIAEVAARERLAGTAATVFAQPGVPRSLVGWKLAAVGGCVGLLALPALARASLTSPRHGVAQLLGLVFVAGAATGMGWLSGGGKLFLGSYTALWYLSIQPRSPVDFTGAFAPPQLGRSMVFAALALLLVLAAALGERRRRGSGW